MQQQLMKKEIPLEKGGIFGRVWSRKERERNEVIIL